MTNVLNQCFLHIAGLAYLQAKNISKRPYPYHSFPATGTTKATLTGVYSLHPPENCHLNVKKYQKTFFFQKNCQKFTMAIFLKKLKFLAIFLKEKGQVFGQFFDIQMAIFRRVSQSLQTFIKLFDIKRYIYFLKHILFRLDTEVIEPRPHRCLCSNLNIFRKDTVSIIFLI